MLAGNNPALQPLLQMAQQMQGNPMANPTSVIDNILNNMGNSPETAKSREMLNNLRGKSQSEIMSYAQNAMKSMGIGM